MNRINGFIEKEAKNLARQIAKERIAPGAAERDKNGVFPHEPMQTLGESGIL
ncbi:MAG: acyl-CoA dehydrogenase family protein, partial [bacterium]